MSTYELTHEKILESGRNLFLKFGYERTNLRELCNDAGITTGAFYRHFIDKEALFSALVSPVVEGLEERYAAADGKWVEQAQTRRLEDLFAVSSEDTADFVRYMYEHLDAFKLLLCCSYGTRYVDFLDWLAEKKAEDTLKLYKVLDKRHSRYRKLSLKELKTLYHAYYSGIFQTVLLDYPLDDALTCASTLAAFCTAGWREAHGLNLPKK